MKSTRAIVVFLLFAGSFAFATNLTWSQASVDVEAGSSVTVYVTSDDAMPYYLGGYYGIYSYVDGYFQFSISPLAAAGSNSAMMDYSSWGFPFWELQADGLGLSMGQQFEVEITGLIEGTGYLGLMSTSENWLTVNVTAGTIKTLEVTSPNGGEQLEDSQNYTIRWNSSGSNISQVDLEYSSNSGTNWNSIATNENNDGFYTWQVPNINSSNCLVRIVDTSDNTISDQSDGEFSITPVTELTWSEDVINVEAGSSTIVYVIAADAIAYSDYTILSDGSGLYDITVTPLAAAGSNSGVYDIGLYWNLQADGTGLSSGQQWEIEITGLSEGTGVLYLNSSILDEIIVNVTPGTVKNLEITSPNGSEEIEIGQTHTITWSSTGSISQVKIEYSTDNGANWTLIAESVTNIGTYDWLIPDSLSAESLVQISDASDASVNDISNNVFSIVGPAPKIAVMSDVTVDEGVDYVSAVPTLTNGQSTDVIWSLITGPAGMTIDETTGQVSWNPTVASINDYPITIRATNNYGYDEESWSLTVPVSYTATVQASVDSAPANAPVTFTGQALALSDSQPVADKDVTVYIYTGNIVRTLSAQTDMYGDYEVVWQPLEGEAGLYTLRADHPIVEPTTDQDSFILQAMKCVPQSVSYSIHAGQPIAETVIVENYGGDILENITAAVENAPSNISVRIDATPATLTAGQSRTLEFTIEALDESVLNGAFEIELSADGGVSTTLDISCQIVPLAAQIVIEPALQSETVITNGIQFIEYTVTNIGSVSTSLLDISLPEDIDGNGTPDSWLSLAHSETLSPIEPGDSRPITLLVSPVGDPNDLNDDMPIGLYQGTFTVNGQSTATSADYRVNCVGLPEASVWVRASDQYSWGIDPTDPNNPIYVEDAQVVVKDAYTGEIVDMGQTDNDGEILFEMLNEAYYKVEVTADGHKGQFATTILAKAGEIYEIEAFLPIDAISYEFTVTPTEVEDHYIFDVNAVFTTYVPFPTLKVEPLLVNLTDMLTNETRVINYTITNHGLINAVDVTMFIGDYPGYEFKPLTSKVGIVRPGVENAVVVPVEIKRNEDCGCPSSRHNAYVSWSVLDHPEYRDYAPFWFQLYNCCPSTPGGGTTTPPTGGYGPGSPTGDGDGDTSPTSTGVPTPMVYEIPGVDVEVTIQITQDMIYSRDAFIASLDLMNNEEQPISDLDVQLYIKDVNSIDSGWLFGIEEDNVPDGTVILNPSEDIHSEWTIVPSHEAAPQSATQYYIGGRIDYVLNGQIRYINLYPVEITVLPQPQLEVDYFLERDVWGDDPFTDGVTEPSVPFSLAVMVHNKGYGTAKDLTIESAQPEIIENRHGLVIDFEIVDTFMNGQPAEKKLTAEFGNLEGGQTALGQWLMECSLNGHFKRYSVDMTYADSLETTRPPLIDADDVNIHETEHVVWCDVDGSNDGLPDFLVNDIPDEPNLPDTLYMSDRSVWPVQVVEATVDGIVSSLDMEIELILSTSPSGWFYVEIDDPGNADFQLVSVIRSDGKEIRIQDNTWTTHQVVYNQGPVHEENRFHLFDYEWNAAGGNYSYMLTYSDYDIASPQGQVFADDVIESVQYFDVSVIYSDDTGILASTIDSWDILVSNEADYQEHAELISIDPAENAEMITAVYRVYPSGSSWKASDNGDYLVFAQQHQVQDLSGKYLESAQIGTVTVNIASPACLDLETYNLVGLRRVGQTLYEHDYTVTVKNNCLGQVQNARFVVTDAPENITLLSRDVVFDTLDADQSVESIDLIRIRADHSQPVDIYEMDWRVVEYYAGDVSMDGIVELADITALCENWLGICDPETMWCYGADLDRNGTVDLYDFQLLANDWLAGK